MILQELIRNFILYRVVVRPMLVSWKESLTTNYYREITGNSSSELILALQSMQRGGGGEELGWDISDEYEEMSLAQASGTHTITDKHIVNHKLFKADIYKQTALISRRISIMLRPIRIGKKIAKVGKT